MAEEKHVYDESKIKTLSSLEHIRKRTGMYIGRIGDGRHYDDGIYILLKEVVDNAVDEYIMGYGKRVEVKISKGLVSVRDFGRGIPLGKVVECVSRINTGAKYNDEVFQFSVGLNGVGTKAVNALSSAFTVCSVRDGKSVTAEFSRGELLSQKKRSGVKEHNGTRIEFLADEEIFSDYKYDEDLIIKRIKLYAYLNAGLKIKYNGETYCYEQGLLDLVEEDVGDEALYPPLHFQSKMLEIALTHTRRFNETHFSFVNGQFTSDGGVHLSAFREGLLKAFNAYAKKKYQGEDVREGVVGSVAIRLKDPVFESQTKNKLGNTEIRSELVQRVKEHVLDLLHRNGDSADVALQKIEESSRLRKELMSVKKLARDKARAVSLRIPQLRDCKKHFNYDKQRYPESSIFITEGQSAAGSMVSCRDVNTQAIFTLKGKPLNVCNLKRESIYKNDELYNLMRALNVEDTVDKLRYGRVILATDADVDGLHIRNLLLTFFLRFFEPLVLRGHVYVLETPLFRVRNKKKTIYCYSEAERDKAMAKLGKTREVTRFKGLGEISPHEFKHFIDENMRLSAVDVQHQHIISQILSFYMGKNTPERRSYIMDHLVVEDDA